MSYAVQLFLLLLDIARLGGSLSSWILGATGFVFTLDYFGPRLLYYFSTIWRVASYVGAVFQSAVVGNLGVSNLFYDFRTGNLCYYLRRLLYLHVDSVFFFGGEEARDGNFTLWWEGDDTCAGVSLCNDAKREMRCTGLTSVRGWFVSHCGSNVSCPLVL